MRKINILFLIFFLLQFPLEVEAASGGDGGWISSGGELFQDARNPWFVKNTKEVFWCLQVDGSQVSATENQIELGFNDALEYWRKEAKTNRLSNNFFSIATQKFSRLPCMDSRVSLRVIFGKSLLNTKEREFLKDPDKYVGVTVRQEYNPVSLFGSGFIFFSADQDNQNKKIFPRVWSKEKILRYAFMHELGHVFGIPHTGSGIMSEIFLDQIMKPDMLDLFEKLPIESFYQPKQSFSSCNVVALPTRQFFSIPNEHDCVKVESANFEGAPIEISSYANGKESERKILGHLKMEAPDIIHTFSAKPASFLQLTPAQTVFTEEETGFRSFMAGPLVMEYSLKGKFQPKTPGPLRSVYLHASPTTWVLTGSFAGGEVVNLISYASPLGLLFLLPSQI